MREKVTLLRHNLQKKSVLQICFEKKNSTRRHLHDHLGQVNHKVCYT